MTDQIEGFILAGGASSRMGTDKSQLLIDSQKFVDRIADRLSSIASSVTVVGSKFQNPKLRTVGDVYPNWGALGGLHAALDACKAEWALVVACDLPFVTTELFVRLAQLSENHDAVVPIQPDGRPQPLCALYRTQPCRGVATDLIRAGKRRPLDLLEAVNTHLIKFSELEQLNQSRRFFVNINTPADYDEATRPGASV
jgi:molybdopterin-guanine dinucleotide biosynthesis protein A